MYEPQFQRMPMNAQQRSQLVQKAKADKLAFDVAQLLARGEADKAAILAGQCVTLAGQEQFAELLRRYATTKFKIARGAVDEFLGGMPPADVAI